MTEFPVLYSFRRCPYAMRARMAIAVSGVQVELREVVLRNKPPELVEASVKATVPVLVLANGDVIDESLDIMRWALSNSDPENWLMQSNDALISANDGPFKQALDRYKYPHRYDLTDGTEYRDAALMHLVSLNERLSATSFLGGDRKSMTDVAIFPFVRQFVATDQTWFNTLPLPALQAWLNVLLASDLFGQIMTRYPKWTADDEPTYFP